MTIKKECSLTECAEECQGCENNEEVVVCDVCGKEMDPEDNYGVCEDICCDCKDN